MRPAPDPHAVPLSAERRAALRADELARLPRWYSPWLHLGFPTVVGLTVIVGAIVVLDDVKLWQLATVPVWYVLSNATEWLVHRDILHRRHPIAPVLYDRHTPVHHRVFVTGDMAMQSRREFVLVLIPAYGILVLLLAISPITVGLFLLGQKNCAALYAIEATAYVLTYEWLHLAYHLPEDSFVGRLRLVRAMRRHHEVHHAPELMQRWNFNVTVPLWDWVRGTIYRAKGGQDLR